MLFLIAIQQQEVGLRSFLLIRVCMPFGCIVSLIGVRDFHYEKVKVILVGGAERQDSVRVGIAAIDMEKIVLIHDGARPFVKKAYVHQLIAKTEEVGAAILAVPTKETIKEVHQQRVSKTLE